VSEVQGPYGRVCHEAVQLPLPSLQALLAGAEETKEQMRITIEYQETRKPYRWKKAFTARVLFADSKAIFTRGGGSHQHFHASGRWTCFGYLFTHPEVKKNMGVPPHWRDVRISPQSLKRIKGAK
jgi:hypothetical protein